MSGEAPWALEFERRAERDLSRLDQTVARRVLAGLDRLLVRDPSVDLRRLRGSDEWRLRVGNWRVRLLLDFETRTVVVVRVLPRAAAYDRLTRRPPAYLEQGRSSRPLGPPRARGHRWDHHMPCGDGGGAPDTRFQAKLV